MIEFELFPTWFGSQLEVHVITSIQKINFVCFHKQNETRRHVSKCYMRWVERQETECVLKMYKLCPWYRYEPSKTWFMSKTTSRENQRWNAGQPILGHREARQQEGNPEMCRCKIWSHPVSSWSDCVACLFYIIAVVKAILNAVGGSRGIYFLCTGNFASSCHFLNWPKFEPAAEIYI